MRLRCDGKQPNAGARGRQPSAIVRMRETKGNIMSDLYDLQKRAVACKHWRWMPGMLAFDAGRNQHRVIEHDAGREYITTMLRDYNDAHCESSARALDVTPDLADPATLGCLLALVREAWPHEWHEFMVPIFDGISHWYVGCLMPGTSRIVMPTRVMQTGLLDALPPKPTEAEALVAALEAAP